LDLNNVFNTLSKMGKNKRSNMLGRRRKNRTMMWTSLIGLGVSAAAYGMKKNRKNGDLSRSIQTAMSSMQNANLGRNMASAFSEFSKELMPKNKNQQ
jgi:hypothetical protein